ncbi:HD-GYP domain-containing protein [Roseospira navarrensis]|uniref:HD domain-containing protein n=1 Tax=Roseospira navarrensis TaxID=140058 RepID=A0A7X2D4J1_9PROT|nr:HD domain-containing phosphohydrolase [Roseospira navarrensis]MQX38484.1 HD domain-containing protein [Roseospira navarrensis]
MAASETQGRQVAAGRDAPPMLPKRRVAIVDRSVVGRMQTRDALYRVYDVASYPDHEKLMRSDPTARPDAIIIDAAAGPAGGIAAVEALLAEPSWADIPLFGTESESSSDFCAFLRDKGLSVLMKPYGQAALNEAVGRVMARKVERNWANLPEPQRQALQKTVTLFNEIPTRLIEGEEIPYEMVRMTCAPLVEAVRHRNFGALLQGVKGHDNYSYVHSIRVATFLSHFGHEYGLKNADLMTLASGGLLHDIGKTVVPREILNKPGKLDPDEWVVMKEHVNRSVELLQCIPGVPRSVVAIAEQHHEKLDGTGYPHGLRAGALNELTRMAAVVDVFGALTDQRVYKDPVPPETALVIMADMKGHLDQHLVGMLRDILLDTASLLDAV